MANSTTEQRRLWAPHCERHGDLQGAYAALDACFRAYGYQVGPGSGAANCRPITGGTGYSLHAYAFGPSYTWWNGRKFGVALAVDINPSQNPYGPRLVTDMPRPMIDAATAVRTNNGKQVWVWGGYFTPNHDAMHYQLGCSPADLATGIDPTTVPDQSEEDDMTPEQAAKFDKLVYAVNDLILPAVGRLEAKVAAIADPDTFAAALAKKLPAGTVDKAAVKAAVQEVFADAADG